MARYVDKHSDKLMGLAIAPPWGDEESLDELDRAVKDLHLSGVECAAHYGELYLDAPELRPYFKKLNQLNVSIVVHIHPCRSGFTVLTTTAIPAGSMGG
jgi:hypothetical protein